MRTKPYSRCLSRLEGRGALPPTKAYVDALARFAEETGVEGLWHSAVSPDGTPLFPSKTIPWPHPEASSEAFKYLLGAMHGLGRPVLCWYPFLHNKAIADQRPEWRTVFPGGKVVGDWLCPNSPYAEMLTGFCAEVISELGFDGFWFDGFRWDAGADGPGCFCAFCAERFKKDTGLVLPDKIDYDDRTFRIWMGWRCQALAGLMRKVVGAIKSANSEAVVCFNNYRRRSNSFDKTPQWHKAIPLAPLALDCVMSSEVGFSWADVPFQIKMQLAYGCDSAETWLPLADLYSCWVPDVDMLAPLQAASLAAAAGGALAVGSGAAHKFLAAPLKELCGAVNGLAKVVAGEKIPYAAILVSQSTMDYHGRDDDKALWDEAFGAMEILSHAHLQSAIVFDAHVEGGALREYPVTILGNAACLSKRCAESVEAYVRDGGVVFCCKDIGRFDELGYPHPTPVLDGLLGISSRHYGDKPHLPTLAIAREDLRAKCGGHLSFQGWVNWHNESYVRISAKDVEVLADVVCRSYDKGDIWDEDGINGGRAFPRHPGLTLRKVGKGWAIYSCVNFFHSYLCAPRPAAARLFRELLVGLRAPAVTANAPLCVAVEAFRASGSKVVVHLVNAPGTAYRYPSPPDQNFLWAIGELNPVYNVEIETNGLDFKTATLPLRGGAPLEIVKGRTVILPELRRHEVVELTA